CSTVYIFVFIDKTTDIAFNGYQHRTSLMTIQKSNPSVANITIDTSSNLQLLTTVPQGSGNLTYGSFADYVAAAPMEGKRLKPWVDSHEVPDAHLGIKTDEYIPSYQTYS
ncbi:MAG: hypothetical protein IKQ27_03625, partial [Lachnospiraceae bacterium]|nr:hypothetical protein [Lachnospiraceae bacterium]